MKGPETISEFFAAVVTALGTVGGIFAVWARGSKTALSAREDSGRATWMGHLEEIAMEKAALAKQLADVSAELRVVTAQLRDVEVQYRRILRLLLAERPDLAGIFAPTDFGTIAEE